MIQGIQILGLIFALSIMYMVFLNFKRREINAAELLLWIVVWAAFIILTFVPNIVAPILQPLHIVRAMDLYIVAGFMFLIAFHFYTYYNMKRMQKKIERIVRKEAFRLEDERKK